MTCGPLFASLLLSSIVLRAPKKSRRARVISELAGMVIAVHHFI
jgi:hypothetical protein